VELAGIYRPIAQGLEQVDALISARAAGPLSDALKGKRLRPALVLFASGADGSRPAPDAITAAATIELVHTASLIHDDVIDEAGSRREKPALHRMIGVKPAVILADLLFVQGLSMLAELRNAALVHPIIREVQTMCEGQWLEIKVGAGRRCTKQQYREIIVKKTASLFEFCCRAGRMTRAGTEDGRWAKDAELLARFGREFGLMYQLLDDATDERDESSAIARAISEWGGSRYLRRAAGRRAAAARAAAGRLSEPVVRTALCRLVDFVAGQA
jgi:octaprenyl-diphosphate synthase